MRTTRSCDFNDEYEAPGSIDVHEFDRETGLLTKDGKKLYRRSPIGFNRSGYVYYTSS